MGQFVGVAQSSLLEEKTQMLPRRKAESDYEQQHSRYVIVARYVDAISRRRRWCGCSCCWLRKLLLAEVDEEGKNAELVKENLMPFHRERLEASPRPFCANAIGHGQSFY